MIDPARLRRALRLDVAPLPEGGWRVGEWTVDARHGCGCPDRTIRGAVCKHELRARLDVLDPALLSGLREMAAITPERKATTP